MYIRTGKFTDKTHINYFDNCLSHQLYNTHSFPTDQTSAHNGIKNFKIKGDVFKSKSDSDDTGFINNQSVILQHHMYTHPINKIFDHCYAILRKINFWMKLYSV